MFSDLIYFFALCIINIIFDNFLAMLSDIFNYVRIQSQFLTFVEKSILYAKITLLKRIVSNISIK